MIYTTNINIAVDVVAALSDKSLKGNVFLMDNGSFESTNQGTDYLTTLCIPGQLIRWTVYAIDLQTPVAIKNISFLSNTEGIKDPVEEEILFNECSDTKIVATKELHTDGESLTDDSVCQPDLPSSPIDQELNQETIAEDKAPKSEVQNVFYYDNLDRFDWTGYVPQNLVPGLEYNYRLELQMGQGKYSSLSIETSSLKRI
jgi:hypothetical protein